VAVAHTSLQRSTKQKNCWRRRHNPTSYLLFHIAILFYYHPWTRSAALVVLSFTLLYNIPSLYEQKEFIAFAYQKHYVIWEQIYLCTSNDERLAFYSYCRAKQQLSHVPATTISSFHAYALAFKVLPFSTISSISSLNSSLSSIGTTCPCPSKKALRTPPSSPPNPFNNISA
jgi:hypothetical protein